MPVQGGVSLGSKQEFRATLRAELVTQLDAMMRKTMEEWDSQLMNDEGAWDDCWDSDLEYETIN